MKYKKLKVTNYVVQSRNIPIEFNGINIIMLSDLHDNKIGQDNEKLLDTIYEQNPDYILIGGDMITRKKKKEFSSTYEFIKRLSSKYVIYYAMGNHEQKLCDIDKDINYMNYVNKLKKLGIIFLVNETITVERNGESILVTGLKCSIEYYKKINPPRMQKEYLDELLGKKDKNKFQILLAHNPMYFKTYVNYGSDLILSGHVHGGIIRLPLIGGVISTQYRLFPKYDYGKYEKDDSTMVLSAGLGTHTINVRICNPPELVVICLQAIES